MPPRTCLITGGAGFIGCALSRELASQFDKVAAIDNLHPQIHATPTRPPALDDRVGLIVADVTLAASWDRILQSHRPAVIVCLAAETGTGQSLTEASRHANVNVAGLTQMLDALVRHKHVPQTMVLTSSRAVYGEGAWKDVKTGRVAYPGQRSRKQLERHEWDFPGLVCQTLNADETVPHPTNIYGATKLAQEHILSAWALSFGANIHILRLQNVYGPGQSLTNPYTGIVPLFARLAREGKSIPVYEDGQIVRDFVFIDDVADAIRRTALRDRPSNGPYDIGSGRATTIHELAIMISLRYGAPAPHINSAYRNGDIRHAVCDVTKAGVDLGWAPRVRLQQGVDLLCKWIDRK
jgi:dTDP-L-rhamnose 4-epimerase